MNIEKQLEELKDKKAEIRRQREELALKEDLVDSQIKVLARRVEGAPPEHPSRTDRIIEVLRSCASPMSPSEIADRLRVLEPDITPRIVRGTLAYLNAWPCLGTAVATRRSGPSGPGGTRGHWRVDMCPRVGGSDKPALLPFRHISDQRARHPAVGRLEAAVAALEGP